MFYTGLLGPYLSVLDIPIGPFTHAMHVVDVNTPQESILGFGSLVMGSNANSTLTGIYSLEFGAGGWVWDRRRVENDLKLRTQYTTTLGGHRYGLNEAIPYNYWQSGSIEGLSYDNLKHIKLSDSLTWTPQVTTGAYTLYDTSKLLYSDHAVSGKMMMAIYSVGGELYFLDQMDSQFVMFLRINEYSLGTDSLVLAAQLPTDVTIHSLSVTQYRRSLEALNLEPHKFSIVDSFTGEFVEGSELPTEDETGILWANVSKRHYEAVIRNGYLLAPGHHIIHQLPRETPNDARTSPSDPYYLNDLETSPILTTGGAALLTAYFPISNMLSVYDADDNEWAEVTSFADSIETDRHYLVDKDLGIIRFGGFVPGDLILADNLSEATEIGVYPDKDFASWPDSGYFTIESEIIQYASKGHYQFLGCIRGAQSTTMAEHAIGLPMTLIKQGLAPSTSFKVSYVGVLRYEYEIDDYAKRTASEYDYIDIQPATNTVSNNILQIFPGERVLGSVVLEVDLPQIATNLYGPIYYGISSARLTARALDTQGNPMANTDMWIEKNAGPGTLNSVNQTLYGRSNSLGEIYGFFSAPLDSKSLERRVIDVVRVDAPLVNETLGIELGDTLLRLNNIEGIADIKDVWLFEVSLYDDVFGTTGDYQSWEDYGDSDDMRRGAGWFLINGVIDDGYIGGKLRYTGEDFVQYTRTITHLIETEVPGQQYVYIDATIPSDATTSNTGIDLRLIRREAVEYASDLSNGGRKIFYQWDTNALHPILGTLGAYAPVKPFATITSGDTGLGIYYKEEIPFIQETLQAITGGYVVVTGNVSKFKAFARDPLTGRIYSSSEVSIRIKLPTSWVGVDQSGAYAIPHGLTFVTNENNVGGALGGANFYTMNPVARNTNQITLGALLNR
jgi:hypothetical protein